MAVLDYGWIYLNRGLTNAMQLGCDKWGFNLIWAIRATVQDTAGDQHQGFDMQIIGREIILQKVWFRNSTDAEIFMARAIEINRVGTCTVEIRKTTDAIPGSFFAWKSGVTVLNMLFEQIQNLQKAGREDSDVYMISQLKLRQAG